MMIFINLSLIHHSKSKSLASIVIEDIAHFASITIFDSYPIFNATCRILHLLSSMYLTSFHIFLVHL